ncbi:hypothetical protein V1264_004552 [Littorina saxatilis]|uniref:Uncharacterized protein n=1 Tax=Littorina saxatilis TaxID=31220 RepID=A0AAN9B2B3_9CAEN
MDDPLKTCPICNEPCDVEFNTLGKKGCARINDSRQRRQNRTVQPTVGQRVHIECRRDYTNDNNIEKDLKPYVLDDYTRKLLYQQLETC